MHVDAERMDSETAADAAAKRGGKTRLLVLKDFDRRTTSYQDIDRSSCQNRQVKLPLTEWSRAVVAS